MINSIDLDELNATPDAAEKPSPKKEQTKLHSKHKEEDLPDY
jgi:hypothetical protein